MESAPIILNLTEIAHIDWADFTPLAKKNSALLAMIFKYAQPLRLELADLIESQCDALDDKTLFSLKALYHILNQWVLEIPNLQMENLERESDEK
jgi:hypothetical protein